MVQRVSDYARIERDRYETPEWVTDALLPYIPKMQWIWEPACASGKMSRALKKNHPVYSSDLVTDYGITNTDFLKSELPLNINAIITNPPFNREAEKFIRHGLKLLAPVPDYFMAMLLPIDFDSGKTRRDMFEDAAHFAGKIVLTSRIVWIEKDGAAPTTNHAWYFWDKRHTAFTSPNIYYHFTRKQTKEL